MEMNKKSVQVKSFPTDHLYSIRTEQIRSFAYSLYHRRGFDGRYEFHR